jgi:dTDP-4-amino-4,6-dideoxygalactose transaminase
VNVLYLDLSRARQRVATEVQARWQRVLESSSYVLGPEVREFESAFASYLGVTGCVGVGNGTDALLLCLRALDVQPGDEVILPAFSFFATAEAVLLAGAVPVFADVEESTYNLDPASAEACVTPRTVGIIGVHLYGRPFNVDALNAVCSKHGLWLVEDAAQAQGASYRDHKVGGLGALAAWSFYPTKNLGAYGDAGAVTGNDSALVDRVRRIANHGQTSRYHHVELGTNSRLDSLQAAVLNCRLPLLDGDNLRRRELACQYQGGLRSLSDLTFPVDAPESYSVYHQLTIATDRRDELQRHLADRGIGSSVHYPSPLDRQPALAGSSDRAGCAISARAASRVLCLPLYAELRDDEVAAVCAEVTAFYAIEKVEANAIAG